MVRILLSEYPQPAGGRISIEGDDPPAREEQQPTPGKVHSRSHRPQLPLRIGRYLPDQVQAGGFEGEVSQGHHQRLDRPKIAPVDQQHRSPATAHGRGSRNGCHGGTGVDQPHPAPSSWYAGRPLDRFPDPRSPFPATLDGSPEGNGDGPARGDGHEHLGEGPGTGIGQADPGGGADLPADDVGEIVQRSLVPFDGDTGRHRREEKPSDDRHPLRIQPGDLPLDGYHRRGRPDEQRSVQGGGQLGGNGQAPGVLGRRQHHVIRTRETRPGNGQRKRHRVAAGESVHEGIDRCRVAAHSCRGELGGRCGRGFRRRPHRHRGCGSGPQRRAGDNSRHEENEKDGPSHPESSYRSRRDCPSRPGVPAL